MHRKKNKINDKQILKVSTLTMRNICNILNGLTNWRINFLINKVSLLAMTCFKFGFLGIFLTPATTKSAYDQLYVHVHTDDACISHTIRVSRLKLSFFTDMHNSLFPREQRIVFLNV